MNAIDLLLEQHKKTKATLAKLARAEHVDAEELRAAGDELVAHMVIEEHVFYPRVRELDDDLVEESFEEHAVARFELARAMIAGEEQQKARLSVLQELVDEHVEEEEKELLPKVRRAIPASELERLGQRMQAMFERAVELGLDGLVKGPGELDVSELEEGRLRGLPGLAKHGRAKATPPRGRATGTSARAR